MIDFGGFMEIKTKYIDRRHWKRVLKRESAFCDIEEKKGVAYLIKIKQVSEPMTRMRFGERVVLADKDYYWLEIALENEKSELSRLKSEYELFKKNAERELKEKLSRAEKDAENMTKKAQEIISGAKVSAEYIFDRLDKIQKEKDSKDFSSSIEERFKLCQNVHLLDSTGSMLIIHQEFQESQQISETIMIHHCITH